MRRTRILPPLAAIALFVLPGTGRAGPLPPASPVPAGERPFEYRLDGMTDNLAFSDAVPSPESFLGYATGERFTRHHDTVAYVRALAESSDRAVYLPYGRTNQHRELGILTVSSPANIARLDEILERNRSLSRPGETDADGAAAVARDNPAVMWLSFNVHGNEASCTEAAQQLAYTLVASTNREIADLLERVVVVIDPCLNPDGRSRYVHWYEQVVGANPDPDGAAREHHEPWPSGRANHYLFDLNRDWIWGTQRESRARMAMYRRYMPQVHVDYHEQGMHAPYFMGAGDTPYNANIPAESKEWFDRLGRASAGAFDRAGLPYATKERFDYLYPGYGKVTPVYHGAISLLTEQGGHGRAGLSIDVLAEGAPGYNLSLRDRARNHFITAMAYVEHTAAHRAEQIERFARFFRESSERAQGHVAGFVIAANNDPDKLARVWDLCAAHGIEIRRLTRDAEMAGPLVRGYFPPFVSDADSVTIEQDAWYIPAAQPMGRLAQTLFERDTVVEDRDTYDITSWSFPVMLGLDAFEVGAPLPPADLEPLAAYQPHADRALSDRPTLESAYAFFVDSDQHRFPEVLATASEMGIFARLTESEIELAPGTIVPAGSLLVLPSRNDKDTLGLFVGRLWGKGFDMHASDTGYPVRGPAIGNSGNRRFIPASVVLASGPAFSSLSFGHTWHLLDRVSPTEHSVVNLEDFGSVDWARTNVLVLPSGRMSALSGSNLDALKSWLRAGGTVVALSGSATWASSELVGLEREQNVKPEEELPELAWDTTDRTPSEKLHTLTYAQREARGIDRRVPGVLLAAEIDTTHPLAAGLDPLVGFHMFSGSPLPVGDSGYVLARFAEFAPREDADPRSLAPRIGGSISAANLHTLSGQPAVTHHRVGRGNVICFASDPTNRGLNHAGMRLLLHAIHLGPSMSGNQPLGEDDHEHGG
tara:strand:+ start:14723 stop:17524 length:2802 start_codon:yes stop_codon:yes gene_type:complete